MPNEENQVLPEDPREAEPGRGAPGNNHYGVQLAQTIAVNAPDELIPSNVDVDQNVKQLEAFQAQEEETDLHTTDGYVIDEAGQINNFAIEPQMYVEEKQAWQWLIGNRQNQANQQIKGLFSQSEGTQAVVPKKDKLCVLGLVTIYGSANAHLNYYLLPIAA